MACCLYKAFCHILCHCTPHKNHISRSASCRYSDCQRKLISREVVWPAWDDTLHKGVCYARESHGSRAMWTPRRLLTLHLSSSNSLFPTRFLGNWQNIQYLCQIKWSKEKFSKEDLPDHFPRRPAGYTYGLREGDSVLILYWEIPL